MSQRNRISPARGLQLVARRVSLELKLTLLMSTVLAIVLTIALIAVDATLRRYAVSRAEDRLSRATRQIATVAGSGIATQQVRYAVVANDSIIRRVLRDDRVDSAARELARVSLERLAQPADSGLPVELWTASGMRALWIGMDVRPELRTSRGRPELPDEIAAATEDRPTGAADSLHLGPLYAENGRTRFWLVMPVIERGRAIGYIAHQRRVAANPQTQRTLRDLSGDSVSLYYRNLDGSYWSTSEGQPAGAFITSDTTRWIAFSPEGEELLFEEERIGGTPLVVGMSVPRRTVGASASRFMRTLLLLGFALFVGGALAAWSIGRSIARPLADVTRAAGEVAAGRYDVRVPEEGDVETRRLAESFNHMAGEIGTSRAALVEQTERAEAANNAKSEFLTTMSHELRTPLNAIGGYIELLEMELRGPVTDAQRRDLQRIRTSQQHLLGLISSVLDLARIEAGRVTYDLVNVRIHSFLSELDALIAPQAAAKRVTIAHDHGLPDLTVLADHEKLRQVLLNLLSNAIRHTPPGGTITLSAEPQSSKVAIAVTDTGPGIPADRRDEVFEPFVQLDRSLAQSRDGLGLGLAISRDLARGMGGDLAVASHDESGARFVLTLPHGETGRASSVVQTGEMPASPVTSS